jgi:TerC family integral membrane protein
MTGADIALLGGLIVALVLFLWLDLHFFARGREPEFREGVVWSIGWLVLSLAVAGVVLALSDGEDAVLYTTVYLIERSLSLDNLFVFLLIFAYFRVPHANRPILLFWGIVLALVMRGVAILVGVELIERFHVVIYALGLLLLWLAYRILRGVDDNVDPDKNLMVRLVRRVYPVTGEFHDGHWFVKKDGQRYATPLFLCLAAVVFADLAFAIDSIPAAFAITREPVLIWMGNIFALLGLRALFVLVEMVIFLVMLAVALVYAWAAGDLRYSWDLEPETPYLGRVEGVTVAAGVVGTSEWDNLHLAWFAVRVHPDHLRRGYGSQLLAHFEKEARGRGRTTAVVGGSDTDAAAGFAAHHGYRQVYVEIERRQVLAELDRRALEAAYADALRYADGYVLERRHLPTPEHELEQVAAMTAAINDAPTDDLDIEDEVYTAERIRNYETAQLAQGRRMYQVVARHAETGEYAGHTVVAVMSDRPHLGDQHDTAVAPAHRGHRLGLLLKTEMLRWLREAEPQLHHIDTDNAGSNDHMIGINELLGYRVTGRIPYYERKLS